MESLDSEEQKGAGASGQSSSNEWAASQQRPLSSNYYTYSSSQADQQPDAAPSQPQRHAARPANARASQQSKLASTYLGGRSLEFGNMSSQSGVLDSLRSQFLSQQKSSQMPKSSFYLSMTLSNSSQKQASADRRQHSLPESEQKSHSMLRPTLPSDDLEREDEEEVGLDLGVCQESPREEDRERDSSMSSEQRRNARSQRSRSPSRSNNIESILLEDPQGSKTTNRKGLKRMATVQKPFNSPMLIASVVSASASSPASGGDAAKAEGEATGPSGASGSGPRYLNLGSSGSLGARALAGTGTLGGSSSILEVLREESGTPVVEEASETPLAIPDGNWAAWNRHGREQEEEKGGEGQQESGPRARESDDRKMFNNYEYTSQRLRFDSVSSYSLVLSKSGGTTGREGRNSGLNSVVHNQLNKGSRETIPQPQILSFVSQQVHTTSSYQVPRLVMSSKDGGSNMSGQGSILNNFITEGAEEDDAQDGSPSRAIRAAAASLFNIDAKSTSSHRQDKDEIYIDASNEEIAQPTEGLLTSTDERNGRDQHPLITPEGLLCEDGIEQVAARVRKLSDEAGGYRIEGTDSLEFTDNSIGDEAAPREEHTRRHASQADLDGFAHHAEEAVRASTAMSRAEDGELEAPPESMSTDEQLPPRETPSRQLEAEESSFDPQLLLVSSAVFEEGAMPRVVRASQERSPFHQRSPFQRQRGGQVPAVNVIEPTASASMTEEDSLEQSKLAASGRIKRHLHDFIRRSSDLGATLGLTPAAGRRPQYKSDVWASKGLTPPKRPTQPQHRTATTGSFQNGMVRPVIPETDPRRLERREPGAYTQGWPHQHAAVYQSAGIPRSHGAPEYEVYPDATHGEIQMPNYLYSETDQVRGIPSQYMQSCLNQMTNTYHLQGSSPNQGEYTSNDSSPYQTPYKALTARNQGNMIHMYPIPSSIKAVRESQSRERFGTDSPLQEDLWPSAQKNYLQRRHEQLNGGVERDENKAEYDCADVDMDGPGSVCIDDLILRTNTARVPDMDLGSKPPLSEIGAPLTDRSPGKRMTLQPGKAPPMLQGSPTTTLETRIPGMDGRHQSQNRVDEAVLQSDYEAFQRHSERVNAAPQINAQQFDTPRGRNAMMYHNPMVRETQASAMSLAVGGLQTLNSYTREKEITPQNQNETVHRVSLGTLVPVTTNYMSTIVESISMDHQHTLSPDPCPPSSDPKRRTLTKEPPSDGQARYAEDKTTASKPTGVKNFTGKYLNRDGGIWPKSSSKSNSSRPSRNRHAKGTDKNMASLSQLLKPQSSVSTSFNQQLQEPQIRAGDPHLQQKFNRTVMCLDRESGQSSPMKHPACAGSGHTRCVIESRRHKTNHTHQNLTEERKHQFKKLTQHTRTGSGGPQEAEKPQSGILTNTITPVLTSGKQTNNRIFGGDGEEFSDSEQPTSLDNDICQWFGTQHTPSNALALTHATGELSHLLERNRPATRSGSCRNCQLEQRKRSITQEAFQKAFKMTQYLLGQIEQLQKIESEHQGHAQPTSARAHVLTHENDHSELPLYNFAYENTATADDDEFQSLKKHQSISCSSASQLHLLPATPMTIKGQKVPNQIQIDDQASTNKRFQSNRSKHAQSVNSASLFLSARQQIAQFTQTNANSSVIFKQSAGKANQSFSRQSRQSTQHQTTQLRQPINLSKTAAWRMSQPELQQLQHLQQLQPRPQFSSGSRSGARNPLMTTSGSQISQQHQASQGVTIGGRTRTPQSALSLTKGTLSLTKEKSLPSKDTSRSRRPQKPRQVQYQQQQVFMHKMQRHIRQKLAIQGTGTGAVAPSSTQPTPASRKKQTYQAYYKVIP